MAGMPLAAGAPTPAPVSWPGLSPPSTPCGADRDEGVDGGPSAAMTFEGCDTTADINQIPEDQKYRGPSAALFPKARSPPAATRPGAGTRSAPPRPPASGPSRTASPSSAASAG